MKNPKGILKTSQAKKPGPKEEENEELAAQARLNEFNSIHLVLKSL